MKVRLSLITVFIVFLCLIVFFSFVIVFLRMLVFIVGMLQLFVDSFVGEPDSNVTI